MKRDIRLIALDLDGTVLNDQKCITEGVRGAMLRAMEKGIIVMPATGRQLEGIPPVFMELPGLRYALTANGALVYDLRKSEPIYRDCFDNATARSLLEYVLTLDSYPAVMVNGQAYSEDMDIERFNAVMGPEMKDYFKHSRMIVPSLRALVAESGDNVAKITMLFRDAEEREAAKRVLKERGDIATTSSLFTNLEINTLTANKGAGLLALGRLLGIRREPVMAFGDGANDIEMLRAVGYGVAMGGSKPAVIEAADAVTLGCNEDGVAAAILDVLGE